MHMLIHAETPREVYSMNTETLKKARAYKTQMEKEADMELLTGMFLYPVVLTFSDGTKKPLPHRN